MSIMLGYGEGIVLTSDDAYWVSRNNISLDELVLTNKRVHCTYKRNNGLFKKPSIESFEFNLEDIIVMNGQAYVQQLRYEGNQCLQIQFTQGSEYFSFGNAPRKLILQWVSAINNVLGTVSIAEMEKPESKTSLFSSALSGLADTFMDAINSATSTSTVRENSMRDKVNMFNERTNYKTQSVKNYESEVRNPSSVNIDKRFCTNCGSLLNAGAKFCSICGTTVNAANKSPINETSSMPNKSKTASSYVEITRETYTERQQEYVGKIYKCPNCGNTVNISDVICEACGFHFSEKIAIHSARDFQEQLMRVEMKRQNRKIGFWNQREILDATDKEVISLIKIYPIPNTIEDIIEFFHLAVANIDINKSKKSVFNTDGWDGGDRERAISNAWVQKLQSIYAKAELYFPNEPEFAKVKEVYDSIMVQLKMK